MARKLPTPSTQVMKSVSIENLGDPNQWPRKQLTTESGVHAKLPMGRCFLNACAQCEFATNTGMGGYCGKCRSRPVVMESFYRTSYLGGTAMPFYGRGESPRKSYLRGLQRQTCPICEHTYRHNWQVAEFIEDEGCCPKCAHRRTTT